MELRDPKDLTIHDVQPIATTERGAPPPVGSDLYSSEFKNNYFTEMCSGSEEGSHSRLNSRLESNKEEESWQRQAESEPVQTVDTQLRSLTYSPFRASSGQPEAWTRNPLTAVVPRRARI